MFEAKIAKKLYSADKCFGGQSVFLLDLTKDTLKDYHGKNRKIIMGLP